MFNLHNKVPFFLALGIALMLLVALVLMLTVPASIYMMLWVVVFAALMAWVLVALWFRHILTYDQQQKQAPEQVLAAEHFVNQLDVECRRSIREFSPLTLMHLTCTDAMTPEVSKQVVTVLTQVLSRPGDLVARIDEATIGLLLPSTGGQAKSLAEKCLAGLSRQVPQKTFFMGVCTCQPDVGLTAQNISECVTALVEQARVSGEPIVCEEMDINAHPSVLYTS